MKIRNGNMILTTNANNNVLKYVSNGIQWYTNISTKNYQITFQHCKIRHVI